jgi:hypothetical protein
MGTGEFARAQKVGRDDPIAPDEFKKVLPTKAQLAKCVFAAELMFALVSLRGSCLIGIW